MHVQTITPILPLSLSLYLSPRYESHSEEKDYIPQVMKDLWNYYITVAKRDLNILENRKYTKFNSKENIT